MLFFEGQTSTLTGGRIVARIEENDTPRSVERGAVKDVAFLVLKCEGWNGLANEVRFHFNSLKRGEGGPYEPLWSKGMLGFVRIDRR
mgnify:CR=1 FL=1